MINNKLITNYLRNNFLSLVISELDEKIILKQQKIKNKKQFVNGVINK